MFSLRIKMNEIAFPIIADIIAKKVEDAKTFYEVVWKRAWFSEDFLKTNCPEFNDLQQQFTSKHVHIKTESVTSDELLPSIIYPESPLINDQAKNESISSVENKNHNKHAEQNLSKDPVRTNRPSKQHFITITPQHSGDQELNIQTSDSSDMYWAMEDRPPDPGDTLRTDYFECENCSMTFADEAYLKRHLVRCRNNDSSDIRCSVCDKGFTTKGSLAKHMSTRHLKERTHVCQTCGKTFGRKHILRIHEATHSAEKPFKCAECGKAFTQSSNLLRHQRIHTATNYGYKCKHCGQTYTQNKYLTTHIHNHHKGFT